MRRAIRAFEVAGLIEIDFDVSRIDVVIERVIHYFIESIASPRFAAPVVPVAEMVSGRILDFPTVLTAGRSLPFSHHLSFLDFDVGIV